MAARLVFGIVVVTLFLSGCEEPSRGGHSSLTPQMTAIISGLREVKESLEGYGHFAKKEIHRNAEGQQLFVNAAAHHNACITYIGTGGESGMDNASLRSRLNAADAARTKLTEWCKRYGPPDRRVRPWRRGAAEASPGATADIVADLGINFLVGIAGELLKYDVQLKSLEQDERTGQIMRIKQELKNCECGQWSDM
jgi:hypothetical protein